jgi:hypothetical protein
MNNVEVLGSVAKEREVVENVVHWCIKKLMPRVRTLDIEVKLTNCKAYGYCLMTDDHKTFELEIRKGMNLYDLVSTICHEMVHVRQYYRKEMDNSHRWKSRKVKEDTSYHDQPWEKEAFRLEERLALECFKNLQVNLIK